MVDFIVILWQVLLIAFLCFGAALCLWHAFTQSAVPVTLKLRKAQLVRVRSPQQAKRAA